MKSMINLGVTSLLLTLSMNTYAQTTSSLANELACTKSIDSQNLDSVVANCSLSTLNRLSLTNSKINTDINNLNRQILNIEDSIARGEEKRQTLAINTSSEFVTAAMFTGLLGTLGGVAGLGNASVKVAVAWEQRDLSVVEAVEKKVKIPKRVYGTMTGLGAAAFIYAIYEINTGGAVEQTLKFQKSQIFDLKRQLATMQQSLSIVESAKLVVEAKAK